MPDVQAGHFGDRSFIGLLLIRGNLMACNNNNVEISKSPQDPYGADHPTDLEVNGILSAIVFF